jgi:nitronate monooxygenase
MQKNHPVLIQGGMGIAVSGWKLAKTVSTFGQLGVVSGTAINSVLVRRLQDGDLQGDIRRAMKAFPVPAIAEQILNQYFINGGKSAVASYKRSPMFAMQPTKALLQLNVVASFVEVFLAKEGHGNPVGFNLLEKVLLPNLSALYGAMLAGADYVIMGAGIPREIPGALDLMAEHKPAQLKVPVAESDPGDCFVTTFNPVDVMEGAVLPKLKRPYFLPIVSSSTLAKNLKNKATGEINGFIVESPLAGGHNAPPRGPTKLSELGEPIYGERDVVDLDEMKALGLPFWMAGFYATPEKLAEVQAQGAQGIQVGTLFAFCQESGLDETLRREVIGLVQKKDLPVNGFIFTDPRSSPTGFPFKAVRMKHTLSETKNYESRQRICDLGYLRHAYKKADGGVGQRCPAEPVADFVKKQGDIAETVGRKCLCNALMADIGLPQTQSSGDIELSLMTAGDDLNLLSRILKPGAASYSATDVFKYLLGPVLKTQPQPQL